jgi:MoxR-like ATPase
VNEERAPAGEVEASPSSSADRLEGEARAFLETAASVRAEVAKSFLGSPEVVDAVLASVLAGGHVLLEGVPGLGKTLLVRTLARVLGLSFSRVQCTPDLLPADVLGTTVLADAADGACGLRFQKGPVFAHLLLVDEINRATPKTQSALLQAMQEGAVTAGDATHALPDPFLVLATENPVEMEGTYPLPEAELDRFLVKVLLAPPPREVLEEVVRATTGEPRPEPAALLDAARVRELRRIVRRVHLPAPVLRWIVDLTLATQPGRPGSIPAVDRHVRWGAGPRAAQALALLARATALLDGRWNASFEDARRHATAVLRHRLVLSFEAEAEGVTADAVAAKVLEAAPPRA